MVSGEASRSLSRASAKANGAKIVGANGDQRGFSSDYHEGVSPQDMYFAHFDGFVFVPVTDDPLSGSLPPVDQLG